MQTCDSLPQTVVFARTCSTGSLSTSSRCRRSGSDARISCRLRMRLPSTWPPSSAANCSRAFRHEHHPHCCDTTGQGTSGNSRMRSNVRCIDQPIRRRSLGGSPSIRSIRRSSLPDRQPAATRAAKTVLKRPPLLPTNLKERLRDTEKSLVEAALDKARFNQKSAAEMLGLTYHQFRGKLRKYGIDPKAARAQDSSR